MKKLLFLFTLLAPLVLADPPTITVLGQNRVSASVAYWSAASGNWTNKTRHLFLANNVYVDTSSTGMAGEWKRVDNTGDSCSNPVLMTAEANGKVRAIFLSPMIWENVYSVDKDSSTHVYRLQTRERFWNNAALAWLSTPWTQKGNSSGYADVTVSDSILIPNVLVVTTKTGEYGIGSVFGAEVRLCPDDVAATANQTGDSVIVDTSWVVTR
jgi:hypothetical protein